MVAFRLAGAGREVTLLEKEREAHHKVCGEFLSREAIQYLRQAGIDPLDLGAHTIDRVRLHSRKRTVEACLPFTAFSLSRRILDEALLLKAEKAGCDIRRGACVERLEATGDGWSVRVRGEKTIRTKTIFLATGKHDLNAWERGGATQPDLVGFKMHWKLAPRSVRSPERRHGAVSFPQRLRRHVTDRGRNGQPLPGGSPKYACANSALGLAS